MNEMVAKKDPAVLAVEIRSLQQQAQVVVLSYAIEIGRRLCEAKAVLKHGQWGEWLRDEVNFSQSSAQNYMRIYERYGSDQLSLFGEAKSETLGNLPYTKALKLLAVPEDEMESFMEENPVEEMSTRELEQAIRERDRAMEELTKVRDELAEEKITSESFLEEADEAREALSKAEEKARLARVEAEALRKDLEELQARPVEVAVQGPSAEMLEEIRAEEEKKFKLEREKLELRAAAAEEKAKKKEEQVKKLKEDMGKAEEKAKESIKADIQRANADAMAAQSEKLEAEHRAEELEKRLKLADSSTAIFQVYFDSVQEDCNRMLGLIKKADPETAKKLKTALRKLLDAVAGMMGERE